VPIGHVTLIKFYDDADQRTFGGTHADDPLTGGTLLSVDSTGVGSSRRSRRSAAAAASS